MAMRYFRLSDDMNVQGRWLLGEPTDSQGQEEEPHAERAPRHEADAQLLAKRDDRSKWMLDECSAKLTPKVGTPERGRYLSLVADVMIGSMFIRMRMLGGKTGRPKLEAYVDRLQARPKGLKLR